MTGSIEFMIPAIKRAAVEFKEIEKDKTILIISHYDTDGITSAAILAKTLQREDKKFNIRIVKQLERELLDEIKKEFRKEIIFFLDLGSGSLDILKNFSNKIFILDHHECKEEKLPENIKFINPHLFNEETEMSASAIVYLFAKEINKENKDLSNLAVLGMVGDMVERELSRVNSNILKDSDVMVKKGLLLFSATRPISRALEYSSEFFIPGVTGSSSGVTNLLRSIGIDRQKILLDLTEEEISKLVTTIILKTMGQEEKLNIIGNIYLIKFFNRVEDARELSTLINACSRLGYPDVALSLCLGNSKARMKAESIYNTYKHEIVASLNWAEQNEKLQGDNYVIINAKSNIKDTIIGTVTSIIASSFLYKEGTIIVGMAYRGDKIKISIRKSRGNKINLQNLLSNINKVINGEFGGHANAAGCLIDKEKEQTFIDTIKKELETEAIQIKV
ncbi:DHH family phosphoesterase [Candidatus Pacearchaeota archaeon]|nr:DHH family phosphoesterase [Candidatus Pacearchaeota archaeon]